MYKMHKIKKGEKIHNVRARERTSTEHNRRHNHAIKWYTIKATTQKIAPPPYWVQSISSRVNPLPRFSNSKRSKCGKEKKYVLKGG